MTRPRTEVEVVAQALADCEWGENGKWERLEGHQKRGFLEVACAVLRALRRFRGKK